MGPIVVAVRAVGGDRIALNTPDIFSGEAVTVIMMGDMGVYLTMVTRPLIGVNLAIVTSILVNTKQR